MTKLSRRARKIQTSLIKLETKLRILRGEVNVLDPNDKNELRQLKEISWHITCLEYTMKQARQQLMLETADALISDFKLPKVLRTSNGIKQ